MIHLGIKLQQLDVPVQKPSPAEEKRNSLKSNTSWAKSIFSFGNLNATFPWRKAWNLKKKSSREAQWNSTTVVYRAKPQYPKAFTGFTGRTAFYVVVYKDPYPAMCWLGMIYTQPYCESRSISTLVARNPLDPLSSRMKGRHALGWLGRTVNQ